MKIFITQIYAKDPLSGEFFIWSGPPIFAKTFEEAVEITQMSGRGYLKIAGELHTIEDPVTEEIKNKLVDFIFNIELIDVVQGDSEKLDFS